MMRVLSLWQPWASLTCTIDPKTGDFAKMYETRHWTPLRGLKANAHIRTERPALTLPIQVAIHATLKDETKAILRDAEDDLSILITRCGLHESRPRGAIIATATISEIWPTDQCNPERWEECAGDWTPGRFAWRLSDVAPLSAPVPLKGRQEPLWILPAEIESQLREQVAS